MDWFCARVRASKWRIWIDGFVGFLPSCQDFFLFCVCVSDTGFFSLLPVELTTVCVCVCLFGSSLGLASSGLCVSLPVLSALGKAMGSYELGNPPSLPARIPPSPRLLENPIRSCQHTDQPSPKGRVRASCRGLFGQALLHQPYATSPPIDCNAFASP